MGGVGDNPRPHNFPTRKSDFDVRICANHAKTDIKSPEICRFIVRSPAHLPPHQWHTLWTQKVSLLVHYDVQLKRQGKKRPQGNPLQARIINNIRSYS